MAAAACGSHSGIGQNTNKPPRDYSRKSKDTCRRRAALLFLNNISLDGRPVFALGHGFKETWNQSTEVEPSAEDSSGTGSSQLSSHSGAPRSTAGPPPPVPSVNITGSGQGGSNNEQSTESGRRESLLQGFPTSPTPGPPLISNVKPPGSMSSCPPVLPDPRQR